MQHTFIHVLEKCDHLFLIVLSKLAATLINNNKSVNKKKNIPSQYDPEKPLRHAHWQVDPDTVCVPPFSQEKLSHGLTVKYFLYV